MPIANPKKTFTCPPKRRHAWGCLLLFILLSVAISPASATKATQKAHIAAIRVFHGETKTRLVIELDQRRPYQAFTLPNPERLVIDIANARLAKGLPSPGGGPIKNWRHAHHKDGERIVMEVNKLKKWQHFSLPGRSKSHQQRLVFDLWPRPADTTTRNIRPLLIAIDAGHGGKDPGAIGKHKNTLEKDVTLAVAKRLAKSIHRRRNFKALLIRKRDTYIPLWQRVEKAQQAQADFLVSIHADAFHDSRARGASVYALSLSGASSAAAQWLADSENSALQLGDLNLHNRDRLLQSVLLDLSQQATIQSSLDAGQHILRSLKSNRHSKLHRRKVEQAGFVVLKSPSIPSLLVELAFISNPAEERLLRNPKHQQRLAEALAKGIENYFKSAMTSQQLARH